MCDHIWVRMATCVESWAQESSKVWFIFLSTYVEFIFGYCPAAVVQLLRTSIFIFLPCGPKIFAAFSSKQRLPVKGGEL